MAGPASIEVLARLPEMHRTLCSRFTGAMAGLLLVVGPHAFLSPTVMSSNTDSQSPLVDFSLRTDRVWRVPKCGTETSVTLALEAVNRGSEPIRLPILDSFQISIEGPEGTRRPMVGGTDGIRPAQPVSDPVAPGETFVMSLAASLSCNSDDRPRLRIEDALGGIWWIEPLEPGNSLLHMQFENHRTFESGDAVWTGRADIRPVPVQIVAD